MLVEYHRGDATQADRVLLVVERVAALPSPREICAQPRDRGQGPRREARQAVAAEDPLHLHLGQGGEERFPEPGAVQRDASTRRRQGAPDLSTFDLRPGPPLA